MVKNGVIVLEDSTASGPTSTTANELVPLPAESEFMWIPPGEITDCRMNLRIFLFSPSRAFFSTFVFCTTGSKKSE